jgi:hypothetical protein
MAYNTPQSTRIVRRREAAVPFCSAAKRWHQGCHVIATGLLRDTAMLQTHIFKRYTVRISVTLPAIQAEIFRAFFSFYRWKLE